MTTLHYIHDPLCGWCYGAAPLVKAAREVLPLALHAGGMMAGPRRQRVTPELRAFVMPHDRRIAQLSGQAFGQAYFEGLLRDAGAVFDSEPPITAVLAAETLQGQGAELLARIQTAHYVDGRRIADVAVLTGLAASIGLDAPAFGQAFQRLQGEATQAHIAASRELLARVGGGGFPTFVLERQGRLQRLDAQAWLGRAADWRQWLLEHRGPVPTEPSAAACSTDGCNP